MKCTCPGWYGTQYPWPHHPDCPLQEKNRRKLRKKKKAKKNESQPKTTTDK